MIVGMDFGTTNSGMAVYDGGELRFVPLDPANRNPHVARTALLLQIGQLPYGGRAMQLAINLWRKTFLRAYLARYLAVHPGVTQQAIRTWLLPVAAARLREGIAGEQEVLLQLIQADLVD